MFRNIYLHPICFRFALLKNALNFLPFDFKTLPQAARTIMPKLLMPICKTSMFRFSFRVPGLGASTMDIKFQCSVFTFRVPGLGGNATDLSFQCSLFRSVFRA